MAELRHHHAKGEYGDLNEHLDQQSRLYERNLHIKNSLRMQELLDEESFRRWKKLRFGGQNPPADREPFNRLDTDRR